MENPARHHGTSELDAPKVLATIVGTGEPCVAHLRVGRGSVVVVAADIPCHVNVWSALLEMLDVRPHLAIEANVPGVVVVPAIARREDGTEAEHVIHAMNVSPWDADISLAQDGRDILGEPLHVPARTGAWLIRQPGDAIAKLAYITKER